MFQTFIQKYCKNKFIQALIGVSALGLMSLLLLFIYIVIAPAPKLLDNMSFSPMILDKNGELMRMGLTDDDKYRQRIDLKHIPEHVQKAVLLYEDRHFYRHPGVNPLALLRAVMSTLSGTRRMGASTIAMQVARLRYKLVTNNIPGKLKQMLLALQLVWHYGHDGVLEAYFSLAPYGGNIEGIAAASRVYFRQSEQTLSRSQALALTLIPQNPITRSFKSGEKGRLIPHPSFDKARTALHASWNRTYPKEKVTSTAAPLRIFTPKSMPMIAPHMSMELTQKLQKDLTLPRTLHTTFDIELQNILNERIKEFITHNAIYGLHNASAILLHWPSMEVRALVGSANFYSDKIDGQVDGTRARRSPGSTLKPFIYALALDQGLIHPQTMLMDTPKRFAEYNPENFDKQFQGPLPAHEALRLSRNVPAISLAARLSPSLYTFLQRAKVYFKHKVGYYGLSLVLGGAEVTMRELVGLYAMLANGGVWQEVKTLQEPELIGENTMLPLLSPEAALATLYMLDPMGTAQDSRRKSLPLRYKTGTSNGFRDAWTVGAFGPYILAVWLGNFDNSSNPMLVGNRVAVPLFRNIALNIALKENLQDVLGEKYKDTKLTRIEVCRDTGDVQTDLCAGKTLTWFIPGRSPIKNSNIYRKIWIDPASGLRLCGPAENAQEVVWEFWPSELYQKFAEAGVYKPLPPNYAKPCPQIFEGAVGSSSISIQNPQEGIVYHMSNTTQNTLALLGTSTAHAKKLFWFVNKDYVGSSTPQTPFFWTMRVGKHRLRVLDDLGQSHSITLHVQP